MTDWAQKIRDLIFTLRLRACIMKLEKYAKTDPILLPKNEKRSRKKSNPIQRRVPLFRISGTAA